MRTWRFSLQGVFFMRRLAHLFGSRVRGLFRQGRLPAGQGRRPRSVRPTLESLEDRLVPAVAHSAAGVLNGLAGVFALANTGTLTFTATGSQTATFIDSNVAEFNVDTVAAQAGGPNLWELKTNGNLWELPGGKTANWALQDTGTGAISLAPNGVVIDLKMNGNLWRFKPGDPTGGWGSTPLASGVTDAGVDALGNVYGLKNGNLVEWSSATPTVPTTLNTNGAASGGVLGGADAGRVVSFQVGGNTVAFQIGY